MQEKPKHGALWTIFFSMISIAWVFPIFLVLLNSFKGKAYISRNAFAFPVGDTFVGLENYKRGIESTNFFASFGWTVLITVGSVCLILVCTSMCAWWIVRVNNWAAKLLYTLFLFNMIVPFQMVMFTLSKLADMLKLNTPWGLCFIYLGFGAGLAVFIVTGVVKGIPQSLEESAMIDGASVARIFFQVVVPIMKPSIVSVAILEAMWVWDDGLPRARDHPDHRVLPHLPEVHRQGCHGWCRKGLTLSQPLGNSVVRCLQVPARAAVPRGRCWVRP